MRRRLAIGTIGLAVVISGVVVSPFGVLDSSPGVASAAAGTVTCLVFDDRDMNGSFDGSDVGVEGVEVTACDSTGAAVGSANSGADGTNRVALNRPLILRPRRRRCDVLILQFIDHVFPPGLVT